MNDYGDITYDNTKSVKYYFGFESKIIFLASRFMFGHKFSM